jgi:hypothetical protein
MRRAGNIDASLEPGLAARRLFALAKKVWLAASFIVSCNSLRELANGVILAKRRWHSGHRPDGADGRAAAGLSCAVTSLMLRFNDKPLWRSFGRDHCRSGTLKTAP